MRFPFHVCVTAPPRPSARAAATSLADSDDEVHIPCFSRHTALLSCYGDVAVPLPRPSVSRLPSSTSLPIVRTQPAPQADGRDRCPLGHG
jgi:hypothetical protein